MKVQYTADTRSSPLCSWERLFYLSVGDAAKSPCNGQEIKSLFSISCDLTERVDPGDGWWAEMVGDSVIHFPTVVRL